MSSKRGSSSSSFHSAEGGSSRSRLNEHREKFRSVDNLHLHQNTSRRDSRHFRRTPSNQNNSGAEEEFSANADRASHRRDSDHVLPPDPAEGARRRPNSKQAYSTVDLQDRNSRRNSRQVNSTVDLQGSRTRPNSRQTPRLDDIEGPSMRRNSRQAPPAIDLEGASDRRHSRQTSSLDGAEGTGGRRRSKQAYSTVDLQQGTSGQRHYNRAQSTVDIQGARRTPTQIQRPQSVDYAEDSRRRRNPRQAPDTDDLESNSSRRSSRQARSLDGVEGTSKRRNSNKHAYDGIDVESTGVRRGSRQALSLDGYEGTAGRRRNSRNAHDTVDVESNSSRRSSRHALSLDGAEVMGRRCNSRQALSLDGRRRSRQAHDTVDVESNSSRRSLRQAPTSKHAGEARYRRNPNEAPDYTDVEEAPPKRYPEQEYSSNKKNLRRPDSSQTYSSSDPEGSPPRRDNFQEFPPEDAGDRVVSSDDPEACSPRDNATRRKVQQVYYSDDAASPRPRGREPNVIPKASEDAEGSSRGIYAAQGVSRRTSCVAFSSDDAEGDISRRTSCMGLISGDTGGTISDRSSIEELSSNELDDGDGSEGLQDEEEFHDADDGRSRHGSNRTVALPPGRGEGEVFSDNPSDGDAGDGWSRTRPRQDVDRDSVNRGSNRQRSFAQDEGDINDDMLAVYLSGGHTRANCISRKANSFHGERSSPRKRPKFRSQADLESIHLRADKGPIFQEEFEDDDDDLEVRSSRRSSICTSLPVVDEVDEEYSQSSADDDEESFITTKEKASLDRGSHKAPLSADKRRPDQSSSSSSFDDEDEVADARPKRLPSRDVRDTASSKSSKMSFYSAKEKLSMQSTSKPHDSKGVIAKRPRAKSPRRLENTPLRSNPRNKSYNEPKKTYNEPRKIHNEPRKIHNEPRKIHNEPKGPRKASPIRRKGAVPKVAPNSKGAVPKAAPNSRGTVLRTPILRGTILNPLQLNNTQHRGLQRGKFSSNMSFRGTKGCVSDAEAELAFYSAMDVTSLRPSRPMINAAGVCSKCTMICKKENMLEGELDKYYCRRCYEKLNGAPRPLSSYPFSVHYSSTSLCTETTADSTGLKVEACTDMGATCTICVTMMNVKEMEKIDNKYYCYPCLDKMNSPEGLEEENKLVNETNMELFTQMFPNPEEFVCLQPESMEDKELVPVKPLKCPKITCRIHISTTHVESHFRVEHREIPILTTKLGRLNTMEILPNEINYGCKVIMLLNVDDYDFPLTSPITASMCADIRPNELDRPNPKPVMALLCARLSSDELRAYSTDMLTEYSFKPYGGSEEVPEVMPDDEKIIFWVASNMFTDLSYAVCISTRDTERRQKFCGDIRGLEELPVELSANGHSLTLLHHHVNRMSRKGKKPLNVSVVVHHPPEKKA